MTSPIPSALLRNLSEDERKQAIEYWKKLDYLAKTDRQAYQDFVQDQMKSATEESQVIKQAYTIKARLSSTSTAPVNVYINVCRSSRVKPMMGENVPILLARERTIKDHDGRMALLYDAVFHDDVVDKSTDNKTFLADLVALIQGCIDETFHRQVKTAGYTVQQGGYKGPFLWHPDGREKSDDDLVDPQNMTPSDLLHKIVKSRDTASDSLSHLASSNSSSSPSTSSSTSSSSTNSRNSAPENIPLVSLLPPHTRSGKASSNQRPRIEEITNDDVANKEPSSLGIAAEDDHHRGKVMDNVEPQNFTVAYQTLRSSMDNLVMVPGSVEGIDCGTLQAGHTPAFEFTAKQKSPTEFSVVIPLPQTTEPAFDAEAFPTYILVTSTSGPATALRIHVNRHTSAAASSSSKDEAAVVVELASVPLPSPNLLVPIAQDSVAVSWLATRKALKVAFGTTAPAWIAAAPLSETSSSTAPPAAVLAKPQEA